MLGREGACGGGASGEGGMVDEVGQWRQCWSAVLVVAPRASCSLATFSSRDCTVFSSASIFSAAFTMLMVCLCDKQGRRSAARE